MQTVIDEMLLNYQIESIFDKKNAIKEILQEITLCGLSRAGFFKQAVFYGGTSLRIFHELSRFSEDLDFSLRIEDATFDFTKYFTLLEQELNSMGMNLKIENKQKTLESNILSAFLKGNTKEHILYFFPKDDIINNINNNEMIKIKLEVDIMPPSAATFETKYKLLPLPYEVKLYDMESLFAGKIHAVLCRNWGKRVKGRDFYDFIFFLQKNTKVNLEHLRQRLIQTNFIKIDDLFNLDILKKMLFKRFDYIDFKQAKQDVIPFIKNINELDIWSVDFFKSITLNLMSNA